MNLGDIFDKRDKQAEEDRKDAARYRWLRQKSTFISWIDAGIVVPTGSGFARLECNQLDAAIDKAMAEQEATE